MTNPTTPDQGDERSKAYDLLYHFLNNNVHSCDWQEYSTALDLLYSAAQPVAQEAIPPIERDESMDRTYIPLPGGWEVQTQGKGSTFRICNTKTGDRWPVLCKDIHAALEQMARDAHAAALAAPQPSLGAVYLVATGETHEGQETYTRHDVRPPLCDAETLYAAPHPPVSAEAGKGVTVVVPWEPTTAMVNAGQCGCMDNDVTVSIYKAMLAAAPSESAPVSGEVSDEMRAAFEARCNTLEADERDDIIRAVLALAGGKK